MKQTIAVTMGFLFATVSLSLAQQGIWTEGKRMSTARSAVATCVVAGKICAIGGFGGRI